MAQRIATVFGGSGFLGRHVVKLLAREGFTVVACMRDVESGMHLKPNGDPGQIILKACNIRNPDMVADCVKGSDTVINLVGILSAWGKQTFEAVQLEGATNVARAAAQAGVNNLIQISAIGADPDSEVPYAQTKGKAEKAVLEAFPDATILRPSVIFGPGDDFFNKFASMSRFAPALPVMGAPLFPDIKFDKGELDINLFGDGGAKLQPVYVGDVARAVIKCIDNPQAKGQTYELGGPEIMTFVGIMKRVLKYTQRKRFLAPVSFGLGKIIGGVMGFLPNPVLTRDQVTMLESDNVVSEGAKGLKDLGIEPTLADVILPTYLSQYKDLKDQPVHIERRV